MLVSRRLRLARRLHRARLLDGVLHRSDIPDRELSLPPSERNRSVGLGYQLGADTYQHISAHISKTADIELICPPQA